MNTKHLLVFAVASICIFSLKTSAQQINTVGFGQYTSWVENTVGEHMRVDAGGNVGIGTAVPANTLHVNGTVRIDNVAATPSDLVGIDASNVIGKITLGSGLSITGGVLNVTGGGGTAWELLGNAGTNPSTNFIGTTDAVDLSINTNSLSRIYVLSTGNIGIGTTSPSDRLTVNGTFSSVFTSGGWTYNFLNNGTGTGFLLTDGTGLSFANCTTGDANLGWTDGTIGGGFVVNSTKTEITRLLPSTNVNHIEMDNTAVTFDVNEGFIWVKGADSSPSNNTYWENSTGNVIAVLTNDKLMGIRTAFPQQTLHVEGTARITQLTGTPTKLIGVNDAGDVGEVMLSNACNYYLCDGSLVCTPCRQGNSSDNGNIVTKPLTGNVSQIIHDIDGINIQIKDATTLVYLDYRRVQDKVTITLPQNPYDGQIVTFASAGNTIDDLGNKIDVGSGVNHLTLIPSKGHTLDWSDTILCCGVHFTYKYFGDIKRWLLISNR